MSQEERLQKFLARAGVASRRASERLIEQGLVKVNGRVVTEMGTKIDPAVDRVEFEGRHITADARYVYLLVNKPTNMISSASDPEGRPVVTQLVHEDYGRLYPVGRLDWDSEGALLLTNDGALTQLLTHPRHEVVKSYLVKVRGLIPNNDVRIQRLREGVRLDDGHRTLPAEIVRDADTGTHTWFVVSIREGKNRQIRRMFEAVGYTVLRLRRIAYGPVLLADLPPEGHRRLNEGEIEELYEAAGEKRPTLSASRGRIASTKRKGKVAQSKAGKRLSGGGQRGGGQASSGSPGGPSGRASSSASGPSGRASSNTRGPKGPKRSTRRPQKRRR